MMFERDPFDGTFDSLENLADAISEVLGCPITIEDANHRLLAYSSHDHETDPARISTIIGRRVPERVINSLWRDGVIQKLQKSDEPIRISAIQDVGLGNRVAISIRKSGDLLGYIWALEVDTPLSEEDLLQLKKAAQAAKSKLLQLQVQKRKQEEGYQEFFWQLLTGHFQSDSLIKKHAEKLLVVLPPSFQVLVFEFEQEINENLQQQIQYLIKTTQRIRIIFHAADRNQLILLAAPLNQQTSKQDVTHFITDFILQMNDRFRVSSFGEGSGPLCLDDYTKVEAGYQGALMVLEIKKKFSSETQNIFHYEDLGYYRYLPAILEEKRKHRIINPRLHKIRNYDAEHHTFLLETLKVYLMCDSNVKDASDVLHVHVNTLNYRLTRIADIADIDLKNMDQKVSLYLDLKAENLDGETHL